MVKVNYGHSFNTGQGQVCPSPNYCTEVNNLFLDIVSDTGLEQYVDSPTRQGKTLDLVLSTNSNIHDLEVVPGMSDHDAVVFSFSINHVPDQQPPHMAFLYHKADVEGIKADLLNFQNSFLQQDPGSMKCGMTLKKLCIKTHGSVSCGPRSRRVTPVSILTGRKKTQFSHLRSSVLP